MKMMEELPVPMYVNDLGKSLQVCFFAEVEGSKNLHPRLPPPPPKKMTLVYDNSVGLVANDAAELVFPCFFLPTTPQKLPKCIS